MKTSSLAVAFLSFILPAQIIYAQDLAVSLKVELVLGGEENALPEYLLDYPEYVCSDSYGNIYVANSNSARVKVFDQEGRFITHIGARGQGPGEMQEISCMVIDKKNHLIIVDRKSRRFTRFINMGETFISYPIPGQDFFDPWTILPLGATRYLLYYRSTDDFLIHIYNSNFSQLFMSFVPAADIWDMEQTILRAMAGTDFLNVAVIDSSKIIVSPAFYEGVLYQYEHIGREWKLQTRKGLILPKAAFEELDFYEHLDFTQPPSYAFLLYNGREGKLAVRLRRLSRGLFALKDKKIIHFTAMENEHGGMDFGIELFAEDGKFMGYGIIPAYSSKNISSMISTEVLWKDNDDRYYIRDVSGFTAIRVVQMNFHHAGK